MAKELSSYLVDSMTSIKKIEVMIELNVMNKQGMTPLDLAIELKINEAVDFALNSNMAFT